MERERSSREGVGKKGGGRKPCEGTRKKPSVVWTMSFYSSLILLRLLVLGKSRRQREQSRLHFEFFFSFNCVFRFVCCLLVRLARFLGWTQSCLVELGCLRESVGCFLLMRLVSRKLLPTALERRLPLSPGTLRSQPY